MALQGNYALHLSQLERAGAARCFEVRTVEELRSCEALVMPGGESTTISKLLVSFGLFNPLAEMIDAGLAVFGTCAGMILLAKGVVDGRPDQHSFGAVDIDVRRNGYGRQINSFEAAVAIDALGSPSLLAAFVRAPVVERVGDGVEVLGEVEGVPVACRQDKILVTSFHPELTGDTRLHRYFLDELVRQ